MAMRTMNASKKTAIARPKPIILTIDSDEPMKPAKTAIMMTAAAVTTRAPCRKPVTTAWPAFSPWT
jgi:hypothetical protein